MASRETDGLCVLKITCSGRSLYSASLPASDSNSSTSQCLSEFRNSATFGNESHDPRYRDAGTAGEADDIHQRLPKQVGRLRHVQSHVILLVETRRVSKTHADLPDIARYLQRQLADDLHRQYQIAPLQHKLELALLLVDALAKWPESRSARATPG